MPLPRAQSVTPPGLDFATFGDCLKYLRRRSQLTQADLASACGYSPPHISHLENNQRLPDQTTLLALFVPALGLQDEPELVEQLLALAAASRKEGLAAGGVPPATSLPRHNLPSPATPFVGRTDELARIAELLDDPGCRLLTLTGPGGIGKTRLALQAAAQRLGDFSDGAFFVSLVGVSSPDFLVSATADALGFSFQTTSGSGMAGGDAVEDTRTQLLSYLRAKTLLLVMDNFEHLLDGVGLLTDILSCAPAVKILATSREPLAVQEEWVIPVSGLDVPDEADGKPLAAYSAVQLFAQRARHVAVGFSLADADSADAMTRICQQVEGLPLGIELAAGLLRAIPIVDIADQIEHNLDLLETSLRDVPERHRSLRTMFEQSWSLLPEVERAALMKLSVFRGGFRREAAAYMTEAPFRALLALVNKSLVRLNLSGRYDLHELLRQFAEEKLKAAPGRWEASQDRHCALYAAFVHARQDHLERDAERNAIEQIEADIDNVRAAWAWAVDHRRLDDLGRFIRGLCGFFTYRGWWEEGLDTFSRAARMLGEEGTDERLSLVFAQMQARQGVFEVQLRRPAWQDIEARLLHSLAIAQAHGARWEIGYVYYILGRCAFWRRRLAQAREFFEKGVETFRAVGDLAWTAYSQIGVGDTLRQDGKVEEAVGCYQKALAVVRGAGAVEPTAQALERLGGVSLDLGRFEEARQYHQEGLAIRRNVSYRRATAFTLSYLTLVAVRQGEILEARQLARESLGIFREIGDRAGEARALAYVAIVESGFGNHPAAIQYYRETVMICREMNRPLDVANWEGNLAVELWFAGDYEEARRLAARSVTYFREHGTRQQIAWGVENLAVVLTGQGRYREARQRFLEALRLHLELRIISSLLFSGAGMARVIAAEGNTEQALELFGLVLNHPAANGPDIRGVAQSLLTDLEAELPPEVVAAGLERGKSLDLETVIRELLEEAP